jgi:5-epi-alpha-selinene synthase
MDTQQHQEKPSAVSKEICIGILSEHRLLGDFEFKANTHKTELSDYTAKWIRKHRLVPEKAIAKFEEYKILDLTLGAYTECDLKTLKVITRWVIMLFINDDVVERLKTPEVKEFNARNLSILNGNIITDDHPVSKGFHSITKATRKLLNGLDEAEKVLANLWFETLVKDFQEHFNATLEEAENRGSNQGSLSLENYKKLRSLTGGVPIVLDLLKLQPSQSVPQTVYERYPKLKELEDMANNILCWANDIVSYYKEYVSKDLNNNIVFLLQKQKNCAFEEALRAAIELHNKELEKFEILFMEIQNAAMIDDAYEPAVKLFQYLNGVQEWIGSHHKWAHTSNRYLGDFLPKEKINPLEDVD